MRSVTTKQTVSPKINSSRPARHYSPVARSRRSLRNEEWTPLGLSEALVCPGLRRVQTAQRDEFAAVYQATNEALIAGRTAALRRTYEFEIQRAEITLGTVELAGDDERVRRLYRGRIANLQIRRVGPKGGMI